MTVDILRLALALLATAPLEPTPPLHLRLPLEPAVILRAIASSGAQRIEADLGSNERAWEALVTGIAKGTDPWLDVAAKLYAVSDSEASETIAMALGEALLANPAGVLRRFEPRTACNSLGLSEGFPPQAPFDRDGWLDARKKAVQGLTDVTLRSKQGACLALLETARAR